MRFYLFILFFIQCVNFEEKRIEKDHQEFGTIVLKISGQRLNYPTELHFSGAVVQEIDEASSNSFVGIEDFLIKKDLSKDQTKEVSIKVKTGEYLGYLSITNSDINPLLVSDVTGKEILFGYDYEIIHSFPIFSHKYKIKPNNLKECNLKSDKVLDRSIKCPSLKIEKDQVYTFELKINKESEFDAEFTAMIWVLSPVFVAAYYPPPILLGTIYFRRKIEFKKN
ncbi:MAG: hypothetical protein SFU98_16915 [Leptospiraceae bacterium]|nr:hypothetical protein [Leptospiraceae bacterium]